MNSQFGYNYIPTHYSKYFDYHAQYFNEKMDQCVSHLGEKIIKINTMKPEIMKNKVFDVPNGSLQNVNVEEGQYYIVTGSNYCLNTVKKNILDSLMNMVYWVLMDLFPNFQVHITESRNSYYPTKDWRSLSKIMMVNTGYTVETCTCSIALVTKKLISYMIISKSTLFKL